MTETIKQKALALVNEAAKGVIYYELDDLDDLERVYFTEALCRAIKQHEAFRQEVSDAVEKLLAWPSIRSQGIIVDSVARFIIAKPDPLVDLCYSMGLKVTGHELRAAIEKRGGKIIFNEEQN